MSGREEEFSGDMERFVIEVADMLFVKLLSQRVGFSDGHELEEPGAIGVGFNATLGNELPETIHHAFSYDRAIVTEKAIAVVMLRREFPRAKAPQPRDPDRRVRLLNRVRPHV